MSRRTRPIIVVTSVGTSEAFADAMQAGANECLLKPIYPDVMLASALRLMGSAGA